MAKLDPNQLLGILHGKLGGLVFVRNADGTVHVRHSPVREAGFTEGELSNQARFKQAVTYVGKVRQQPDVYTAYQAAARAKGKRACDLANADCRHPPIIQDVDLSSYKGEVGEPIRVQAIDDFAVTAVTLTLTEINGLLLEQGSAVLLTRTSTWLYLTETAIPAGQTVVVVHVSVCDRAGNVVTKTFDHRC